MSSPISIETTGKMYPYIVSSSYENSNGSYYLEDDEVIINGENVNNVPTMINDGYEFEDNVYQVFTLAGNQIDESGNPIPHVIKANRDCELNFMLIGGGAPGGTSGSSGNRSNGPGGNAGSVITGKLQMKTNDKLNVTCYWEHYNKANNITYNHVQVDTLEWMGKEKNWNIIGGDIKSHDDNFNSQTRLYFSCPSTFTGSVNDKYIQVTSGGAFWPISEGDVNTFIEPTWEGLNPSTPTSQCQVVGIDNINVTYDTSVYGSVVSENFTIHKAREGGGVFYYQNSPASYGLASGFGKADTDAVIYESVNILGNQYILPCGGGGGGVSSFYSYNYSYNISTIPNKIASNSFAGSGIGGGGFGNNDSQYFDQYSKRILDAWMPGAGGGGAFQNNKNSSWTNGYGGQGVMLCWIKY